MLTTQAHNTNELLQFSDIAHKIRITLGTAMKKNKHRSPRTETTVNNTDSTIPIVTKFITNKEVFILLNK